MTGSHCAHAHNRNLDYHRPWRDPVLDHRQILSRSAASAATQAVSGSGLFGVDRRPDAATAWLSVTSLIALTNFAPHIVGENLTRP